MIRSATVVIFFLLCAAALGDTFYAATDGSSGNGGTYASPWDLTKALDNTVVKPGDTVFLRGGTYGAGSNTLFYCKLAGAAPSRIYVRPFPGEQATIDGGIEDIASANWVVYWGLEVMNSYTVRECSGALRAPGFNLFGGGASVYNCVIHDTGHPGIGYWSTVGDGGEVHGTLIYHVGTYDTDITPTNTRGSAIYTQNQIGTRYLTDGITFRNFTTGGKAYTQGGYADGYRFEGNTAFDNPEWNQFVASKGNPTRRLKFLENYTYQRRTDRAVNVQFGYYVDHQHEDCEIRDNYLVAGSGPDAGVLHLQHFRQITFTGNTFVTASRHVLYEQHPQQQQPTWNNNTYHGGVGKPFARDVTTYNFSDWKTATGFDADSAYSASYPTAAKVFVRKNKYEDGRANITVYNWPQGSSVSVDASGVLSSGDAYEVRDAQNFYGSAVLTGTYTSGNISIPMNQTAVSQPIGSCPHLASRLSPTAPEFGAFVLMLKDPVYVFVEASGPQATELGPTPGEFTIRRTGDLTNALAVNFTVGGTATPGADYAALVGPLVIPAQASSATLAVTPVPDAIQEGDETVVLTLAAGAGYRLDPTATQATVTIQNDATPPNTAPVVDAGPGGMIIWPANTASLDGTVTDDGQPVGKTVTTTWSKAGGPGAVAFANATAVDTTATFSTLGTYVLQLTASDTELTASDTVTISVEPDLMLHLKLDETSGTVAADASIAGRDGAVAGAGWVGGAINGASSFDEIDDRVVVRDFALPADFSVSFWFRPTDNDGTSYQYMFSWGTVNQYSNVNIFLGEAGAGSVANTLRTYVQDSNDSLSTNLVINNAYADGLWHHYCLAVARGAGAKVYVDGEVKSADPAIGGDGMDPATDLYLGGRNDLSPSRFYGGGLDDVRVYGRALANDEVRTLFDARIRGDFNGDGKVNIEDVDAIYAILGTNSPPTDARFDLTNDGKVDITDARELVQVIIGTSMADTNLDKSVDIVDLGNLANGYGMSGGFGDGDTDGNGVIDILDLGNLANDYGKTYQNW